MHTYIDLNSNLAVIAPAVPGLITVLGPLLAVTLFTFIVAIPRWFLMLFHCLWCRVVPASIRCKSIPGVRSQMFEGVVKQQFVDKYTFSVQQKQEHVSALIGDFLKKRGARLRDDGDALTFERGYRLYSYLLPHIIPWRERNFRQEICVTTTPKQTGHTDVSIRYIVQALYMLRVQPAGLQREVEELFAELNELNFAT